MCGIVGIVGKAPVSERLLIALRRLEYRGYDSAGLCTSAEDGLTRYRASGKLINLEQKVQPLHLTATTGIAHTRWATHGHPTERNAHPHLSHGVAVVHNGIIENFRELRMELEAEGVQFESQTDSEVIAHLIAKNRSQGASPEEAVQKCLKSLQGAFALAILFEGEVDLLIGARHGSPLVVGAGDGEMYLGSDALALAMLSQRICYLEEGDWVVLTGDSARMYTSNGQPVDRPFVFAETSATMMDKGNYRHYMQKEIFEQPLVLTQTLSTMIDPLEQSVLLDSDLVDCETLQTIHIVACGTSYYAGMLAQYWIEKLTRIPVNVDIASEFRYRDPVLKSGDIALFISQSGETSDTLAALKHCKEQGLQTLALVNVETSSMVRQADQSLLIHAGIEIGVASTKAFICQIAGLFVFAVHLGRCRGGLPRETERELVQALLGLPTLMNDVLQMDRDIARIAAVLAKAQDILYFGRGLSYPVALEGALKLKEISYIHAEAYAAGEMKHGPIALIDETVPVIVIAPEDSVYEKTMSNMQEAIARGARVLLIGNRDVIDAHGDELQAAIAIPETHPLLSPFVSTLPVQLLAYHVAVAKGTDVDQPRNLAKSVTVE